MRTISPSVPTALLALTLALGGACELTGGGSGDRHPCAGHRTDTVWDDGDAVYVGCGSTAAGKGLYVSTDLGRRWKQIAGTDGFRVSQVARAVDGGLYLAGLDAHSGARVARLDGDGPPTPVLVGTDRLWNTFHAGSYAQTPAGLEVAESLNGYDLAIRDGGEWRDGSGWGDDGGSYQIHDLALSGSRLIGVGSTILQPPMVFVQTDAPGFSATPVALGDWSGELGTVDADGDALVVGGVDQDSDVGVIFTTRGDPRDPGAWQLTRLDHLGDPTWIRAVCRLGDRVVAAGEYSTGARGLLLESDDGGLTWQDRTPEAAPSLTACHLSARGLVVAGAEGWFAAL